MQQPKRGQLPRRSLILNGIYELKLSGNEKIIRFLVGKSAQPFSLGRSAGFEVFLSSRWAKPWLDTIVTSVLNRGFS